jgi:hypothetical protein
MWDDSMFACGPFGTHDSFERPGTFGSEFIREGDVEADEDVANVLASSRMNSLPQTQLCRTPARYGAPTSYRCCIAIK